MQILTRPHQLRQDPARFPVPAYHPDTPAVRHDWAQHYDNVHTMDGLAGKVLDQLKADGLAGDTTVFFYSDHGSGMPRSKRCPYTSGRRVPPIVSFLEQWRALAPAEYNPAPLNQPPCLFVCLTPPGPRQPRGLRAPAPGVTRTSRGSPPGGRPPRSR